MSDELHRQRCREKTGKGNCYPSRAVAKVHARRMTAVVGNKVVIFKCPICGQFHLAGKEYLPPATPTEAPDAE
jgi:hypothetical protein